MDSLVIIYRIYTHSVWLYTRLRNQTRNAVVVIAWILVRMVKSRPVYLLKLRRMAMTDHTQNGRTENYDK